MTLTNVGKLGYGGQNIHTTLPNTLLELQGHTISGPFAGVAANTPIPVPQGIDSQDTIQKVLTLNGGVLADVTANTTIVDLQATATVTLAGVVAGDKVVIAGTTFTFRAANVNNIPPGVVPLGATDAASATNLAAAISNQIQTLEATATGAVVTILTDTEGTAGNAATLSVAGSNGHMTDSGGTFTGGSVANAININVSTAGGQVLLFWYKKSRVIGEV
jgi:hypothetical protein